MLPGPPASEPHLLFRESWRLFQIGQLESAERQLLQVLQSVPKHADAWHLLAAVAQAQGRLEAAADFLQRSLNLAPDNAHAWSRSADVHESLGQPAQALERLERACRLQPTLAPAQYNRARLLRAAARPAEALDALVQARESAVASPLMTQVLQLQAQLEEDAGRLHDALATVELALTHAPNTAALHHNRGVLLLRTDRPEEAVRAHAEAKRLGLNVADAHYNRGNALMAAGCDEQAVEAYRTALDLQPLHSLALFDLARLRWRLGHVDFAAELDVAIQNNPASALALGIKGRLLLRAERLDEAAEVFATAVHKADAAAGHFDGLGLVLSRMGENERAIAAHIEATRRAPAAVAGYVNLAAALLRAGRVKEAEPVALHATALAPRDQDAWAVLWVAWRAAGDQRASWLTDLSHSVGVYDLDESTDPIDAQSEHLELARTLQLSHRDALAPLDQTLRRGTQTHGNLLARPDPALIQLRDKLHRAVQRHVDRTVVRAVELPNHPWYAQARPRWRFSDSWSSLLRRGGFHTRHVHPHGWLSSVYYVCVPPSVGAQNELSSCRAGWLDFGQPDFKVGGQDLGPLTSVQPRVGRLVLFPSFLWHSTRPFDDDAVRLTVAFDALPLP